MKSFVIAAVSVLIGFANQSIASLVVPVEAFNNATVQPAGPRAGANGKNFFNIEGSNNLPNNASYGIARWDVSAAFTQFDTTYGPGNWTIDSVQLQLTESNAAFSHAGMIRIGHTDDDSVNIEPAPASTLTYPITGDFPDSSAVLDYNFPTTGNVNTGTIDTYTLFDSSISNTVGGLALAADLNAEPFVTLTFEELQPDVAATYAGFGHNTLAGPTLVITATPEPGTIALLGLGMLAVLRRKSR